MPMSDRFTPNILALSHRTPRLLLRQLAEPDRAGWVRMHEASAAHFKPWVPTPRTSDHNQMFDERLKRAAITAADGTGARFGAFLATDQHPRAGGPCRLVGLFSLNNIVRGVFQNADAGWMVSAEALGHGFATEGVIGLLDLAFLPPPRGLGLHRVQANIIPSNAPSLRVAEKAGFRREGLAARMLQIDDRWQDHLMLAVLAEEHPMPPKRGDPRAAEQHEG